MDYKTQTIGIIYRAKNTKNSKIYIGYTRKSFEFRKHQHEINAISRYDILAALKRNKQTKHFYNAIRLYGLQSFEWSIICEIHCLNHDDINMLKEAEKIFIRYYDSTNTKKGYNKTKGGDGVLHAGSTMEEIFGEEKAYEIKKKISDKCRGMKLSPEQKKRWRKKINSKEYKKKFLKAMRDPIRRAKISAGLIGHVKKSEDIKKQQQTFKKTYPITPQMEQLITNIFIIEKKSYNTLCRHMRKNIGRSISKARLLEVIHDVTKKHNCILDNERLDYLDNLKNGTLLKNKTSKVKKPIIDSELHTRIIMLALRGFSPYIISVQLKAEGAIIDRGKIRRLIESENKKRQELQLSLITTDKRMKGPFISNIRF